MANIEAITKGAKDVAKRATNGDNPLKSPAGLAVAGAALAAIPYAAEKLGGLGSKLPQVADELKGDGNPLKALDLGGDGNPLKAMLGSGEDEGEDSGRAAPGFGDGRRMPVQQAVDVALPVKDAYAYWTAFEEWPKFMHRIQSAEQVDRTTVSFGAKIWGVSKRFEAEIVEQRPDERIEWNVTDGYAHTGTVTFHPLSKNLTRIDVSLDIQPSNLVDKASRGMRFVKRAVRADLHRFKAYAELEKDVPDAWRGTIEDGKVKRKRSSSSGPARSRNGSSPNGSKSKARAGS